MPAIEGAASGPQNNLLQLLSRSDFALLFPYLDRFDASAQSVLYNPADDVQTVYFPCGASSASFVVAMADGREMEILLVGREGAIGGIVSQGHLPAYARTVVKFGGTFARLSITNLEAAQRKSRSIANLFARYADCLIAQLFQSTACNAVHSMEQRAAKSLIAAMDRIGQATVPLTHEQLAATLGAGRSYASRVIQSFKAEHVLDTRRGALIIRDEPALRAKSCRCDDAVRSHFSDVLGGVYPPLESRR